MIRRATAEDRQIASVLRGLPIGNYTITVLDWHERVRLTPLKPEGATKIQLSDKTILIVPECRKEAA